MTDKTHVNAEQWRALLQWELSAQEKRVLLAHLDEDCDICDAVVANADDVDAFDGVVDEALGVQSEGDAHLDELGFARVKRQLTPARGRAWMAPVIGLAAAAALAIAIFIPRRAEDPWRIKGEATQATAELEVLEIDGTDIRPLAEGATVPAGTMIAFRVRSREPVCVLLWTNDEVMLDAPVCFEVGAHVLERGGQVVGLPVSRLGINEIRVRPVSRDGVPTGDGSRVRIRVVEAANRAVE